MEKQMSVKDEKPPQEARKILVVHCKKSELTKEELKKLLLAAGEAEAEILFIDPEEEPIDEVDADCVVVPLETATAGMKTVDEIVLKAAQAASAIIGVWGPGEKDESIHPAVAKYGKAQVPWDAEKLKEVLYTECPPPYQTPTGAPSEGHETKPHQCK